MLNVLIFFQPQCGTEASVYTNSYRAWTTKYIISLIFINGPPRRQVFLWSLIAKNFQCLLHLQERAHEQDQFSQDIGMTCGPRAFSVLPWELGRFHGQEILSRFDGWSTWNLLDTYWGSHPFGHHWVIATSRQCWWFIATPSLPRESRAEAPINHVVSESWYIPPNINMCPKKGAISKGKDRLPTAIFSSGHTSRWYRPFGKWFTSSQLS